MFEEWREREEERGSWELIAHVMIFNRPGVKNSNIVHNFTLDSSYAVFNIVHNFTLDSSYVVFSLVHNLTLDSSYVVFNIVHNFKLDSSYVVFSLVHNLTLDSSYVVVSIAHNLTLDSSYVVFSLVHNLTLDPSSVLFLLTIDKFTKHGIPGLFYHEDEGSSLLRNDGNICWHDVTSTQTWIFHCNCNLSVTSNEGGLRVTSGLAPRYTRVLRSSGILRSVQWSLRADVSRQLLGPILKGKEILIHGIPFPWRWNLEVVPKRRHGITILRS
jgi:hypothetical protein